MVNKNSLKDKVQRGVKNIVPALLIFAGSLGSIDSAQAQSSGNNDSGFRSDISGGGKYSGEGISQTLEANPQFNLNKKGENSVWLGPYFTKSFGNKYEGVETHESSTTELVNNHSGTEKNQETLYEKTTNTEKPYGFGLKSDIVLGGKGLSELELRAGAIQKNTSVNEFEEKSITYSRGDEVLSDDYISDTKSSSDSEYISDFSAGFKHYLGDRKKVSLGGFIGNSDSFYGGLKLGVTIGGKKGENDQ